MMFYSDVRIIKKCQNGELQAFSQLYNRYFKKIYDFSFYKTLKREAAEDITSLTFMKALEKIALYDETKGSVSSWIFAIAWNTLKDFFKKEKFEYDIDELFDRAGREHFERDLEIKEQLGEVKEYLKSLPDKKRSIIFMRVWQNLSYREISEITGMSEASCKMNFYRTIDELKVRFPGALLCLWISILFKLS
jgi:RNA polymerase sigma-70 factor (ECF subfamily)